MPYRASNAQRLSAMGRAVVCVRATAHWALSLSPGVRRVCISPALRVRDPAAPAARAPARLRESLAAELHHACVAVGARRRAPVLLPGDERDARPRFTALLKVAKSTFWGP
eukprot:2370435-Prymnesium_polylepis.1